MDVGLKRELERKVRAGERLTREDGIALYESDDLAWLGALAHEVRTARHGDVAYFHGAEAGGGVVFGFGGWRERAANVDAMLRLREEWDGREQAVVPVGDRSLSGLEVLKTYAVARLLLDGVPHLKVFRETYGDRTAQLSRVRRATRSSSSSRTPDSAPSSTTARTPSSASSTGPIPRGATSRRRCGSEAAVTRR
jgi:aminodeoxyfutalosine synthase